MDRTTENPAEVPCLTCGYDLRGLPAAGACPECGTAIARSLAADRLAASEPRWLRDVHRGLSLLAAGLATALLTYVAIVVLVLLAQLLPAAIASRVEWAVTIGGGMLALAGLCAALVGAFVMTALEPRETEREVPLSARHLARYGLIVCVAALTAMHLAPLWLTGAARAADLVIRLIFTAGLTLALVGALRWLAALARRIPRPDLQQRAARSMKNLRWALPAAVVANLLHPALGGSILTAQGLPGWMTALSAIVTSVEFVSFIVLLVELIRVPRLTVAMRRALGDCRQEAEQAARAFPYASLP